MHAVTGIVAVAAVAITAALGGSAQAAVVEFDASVVPLDVPVSSASYQGIDYGKSRNPRDDRYATTTWRVVQRTGNCCENFLTTTAEGRLLDFGGSYINYSDDRGQTWSQVRPITPLQNGEGAIVAAPGGDVLGVEWDPYTGDHLQFYKYEADTQRWRYTEMPLHQPFYDREWIGVAPGPVTIDGQTYDYVSFVKGGYPTKEVWFMSTDGLNYTNVTSKMVDQILNGRAVEGPLPTAGGAINDWAQPNTNGGMTALGGGGLLAAPDSGSEWGLFDGTQGVWAAYRLPDGSAPSGRFQTDSAGRVHNAAPTAGGGGFDYRVSSDGGRTWKLARIPLPKGFSVEEWDFRAHRAAGVAAVAARAQGPDELDQDFVFKLDITRDQPRLLRMHKVGLGDTGATGGVGNDVRFDFGSVTIFGDGRVALSFLDSTTKFPSATNPDRNSPAIAIEGETTLGDKVPYLPEEPPALGEPYVTYDFEAGDDGWTTGGVPTWSRSAPGVQDGADNTSGYAFGLEGPTQYADNVDATLASPPITAAAGATVLEFWLKIDTEAGFDGVSPQWSADGSTWQSLGDFSGQNDGYPGWQKITLGFESPGGEVRVRFRFTSDLICSALTPACGPLTGARVDHVVVGSQA